MSYRVLHIFSGYGGGISSLILNLTRNKAEDFVFDTAAFTYSKGEHFKEAIINGSGNCYLMPRPRIDGYKKFINCVYNLMKNNKYDAIHCHISGWRAWPFYKAAKKNKTKCFILHAHTTLNDSHLDRLLVVRKINQFLNYKFATHYMTCSDLAAQYIFGDKYITRQEATLLPNGIDEHLFSDCLTDSEKLLYDTEFQIPSNVKKIVHVGRFVEAKNHDFILQIAKSIYDNNEPLVLLMVGDGQLFDKVKSLSETYGISDKIRFLGRRTDVIKIMQYADCMILPSINEGLPTVAVECQACGTPMILSETITKQCDMNLGLLKFAYLSCPEDWVRLIIENIEKKTLDSCLDEIRSNGFTAEIVGDRYCDYIRKIIMER